MNWFQLAAPFIILSSIVLVPLVLSILVNTLIHRSNWPSLSWSTHIREGIKETLSFKKRK